MLDSNRFGWLRWWRDCSRKMFVCCGVCIDGWVWGCEVELVSIVLNCWV